MYVRAQRRLNTDYFSFSLVKSSPVRRHARRQRRHCAVAWTPALCMCVCVLASGHTIPANNVTTGKWGGGRTRVTFVGWRPDSKMGARQLAQSLMCVIDNVFPMRTPPTRMTNDISGACASVCANTCARSGPLSAVTRYVCVRLRMCCHCELFTVAQKMDTPTHTHTHTFSANGEILCNPLRCDMGPTQWAFCRCGAGCQAETTVHTWQPAPPQCPRRPYSATTSSIQLIDSVIAFSHVPKHTRTHIFVDTFVCVPTPSPATTTITPL